MSKVWVITGAGRGMGLDEGEHRVFERVGHGTRSMARDARADKGERAHGRERGSDASQHED